MGLSVLINLQRLPAATLSEGDNFAGVRGLSAFGVAQAVRFFNDLDGGRYFGLGAKVGTAGWETEGDTACQQKEFHEASTRGTGEGALGLPSSMQSP